MNVLALFQRLLRMVACSALALSGALAYAVDILDTGGKDGAKAAPDLSLTIKARTLDAGGSYSNALITPAGTGPFPTIVLVHYCTGLLGSTAFWVSEAIKNGFAIFVQDSYSPRNLTRCDQPAANQMRGTKDAHDILLLLQSIPQVDAKRIGLLGMSWGGWIGQLSASPSLVKHVGSSARFGAIAAMYTNCHRYARGATNAEIETLRPDTDRPLLMLLGGADGITPIGKCVAMLEGMKAKGAPVDWHVYPEAGHTWDHPNFDGQRQQIGAQSETIRYRPDVTQDSARRAFEFFAKMLTKP